MSSDAERAAQLETLLNEAWREYRSEVVTRITLLKDALAGARAGTLDETRRADANSMAHKLAGVLGTFGLREASRAAIEIELILTPGKEISQEKLRAYEAHLGVIGEGVVKRDAQAG